jgi:acyl-CoA dehydrogenase
VDRAIQVHGGMGVSQDVFLPMAWVSARTLRLADGPDEVSLGKRKTRRMYLSFMI